MGNSQSSATLSNDVETTKEHVVLGEFNCKYLGSVPLNDVANQQTTRHAAQRILQQGNRKKKVMMSIQSQKIVISEPSGTIITQTPIEKVAFVSVLGRKQNTVAYVHNDQNMSICHAFETKRDGTPIPEAINKAFAALTVDARPRRRVQQAWASAEDQQAPQPPTQDRSGASNGRPASASQSSSKSSQQEVNSAAAPANSPRLQQQANPATVGSTVKADDDVSSLRRVASSALGSSNSQPREQQDDDAGPLSPAGKVVMDRSTHGELQQIRSAGANTRQNGADDGPDTDSRGAGSSRKNSKGETRIHRSVSTASTAASALSILEAESQDQTTPEAMTPSSSKGGSPSGTMKTTKLEGKYLGHTTVTQPSGDAIVTEAVALVKKSSKPRPAVIYLNTDHIRILDKKRKGDVLANAPFTDVTYCSNISKTRRLVCFITRNDDNVMFCHCIKVKKPALAIKLTDAFGRAFVEASEKAKRTGSAANAQASSQATAFARHLTHSALGASADKQRDIGAPLGLFESQFLGTWPVSEKKGQPVCNDAAVFILSDKPDPVGAVIVVSGEGLKVVEALTSELISNTFIKNVTFTTVIEDKKILRRDKRKGAKTEEALFCFIAEDQHLGSRMVHLFRAGKRAHELCQTINVAFQVALDEQKRRKGNPFAPLSAKRESVRGPLFRRQIHRRDLQPVKVLGMGQFGEVYLAVQSVKPGTGIDGGNTIHRAVKLLRNGASVSDRTEFLRESEIMLEFDHPNLVQLIGVAVQQRPWLCVLEFMQYGDLRAVLRACKDKDVSLTFLEQLKLCVQIAAGMEYLSANGWIHMDLAARNCLLGHKSLVKIADFGLTRKCKEGKDYYRLTTTLKLPIKWMAVESMDEKIFSSKSDVWAFGITCWEIMTYGQLPYAGIKNIDVQSKVRDGYRLPCPERCPTAFHGMMKLCWGTEWRKRPSFRDLRKLIIKFAQETRQHQPGVRDVGKLLRSQPGGDRPMSVAEGRRDDYDYDFSMRGPKTGPGSAQRAAQPTADESEQEGGGDKQRQEQKSSPTEASVSAAGGRLVLNLAQEDTDDDAQTDVSTDDDTEIASRPIEMRDGQLAVVKEDVAAEEQAVQQEAERQQLSVMAGRHDEGQSTASDDRGETAADQDKATTDVGTERQARDQSQHQEAHTEARGGVAGNAENEKDDDADQAVAEAATAANAELQPEHEGGKSASTVAVVVPEHDKHDPDQDDETPRRAEAEDHGQDTASAVDQDSGDVRALSADDGSESASRSDNKIETTDNTQQAQRKGTREPGEPRKEASTSDEAIQEEQQAGSDETGESKADSDDAAKLSDPAAAAAQAEPESNEQMDELAELLQSTDAQHADPDTKEVEPERTRQEPNKEQLVSDGHASATDGAEANTKMNGVHTATEPQHEEKADVGDKSNPFATSGNSTQTVDFSFAGNTASKAKASTTRPLVRKQPFRLPDADPLAQLEKDPNAITAHTAASWLNRQSAPRLVGRASFD